MTRIAELHSEAERLGSITDRLVKRMNPEGYIEYQLRQAVSDAIKEIGRERAMEIIREAAE
ncbi:hypothetical protein [Rhizobium sp. 21-4511-3d]